MMPIYYYVNGAPAIAMTVAALCVAMSVLLVDGTKRAELVTQLSNGFSATHAAEAAAPFEPVLYAPNGAFALGFLRVGLASLDLAVVHLPSAFPLWRATPSRVGDWSRPATLAFDGRLVLTDPEAGVLWRTTNAAGDVAVLLNSSNLVIRRFERTEPTWQSFDNPSDTLVLDQNFTVSSPPLISKNRRFALRLGQTYMALHMEFYGGRTRPMYWQHTALMAQPENATQPPVYGRIDGHGFFGLYVDGAGRVDVLSFDTFAVNLTGALRRMTLEDDGSLRAYYWTNDSTAWALDYKAISEPCALPTACGAYGVCVPGEAQCQCLSNSAGVAPPCGAEESSDLCGGGGEDHFDVVRRKRVSVAYKEQLSFETYKTVAECEDACEANCTCWGAVYNGASGYCYLLDFPIETLVYEADDRKVGYFKVRKAASPATRDATAAKVVVSLVLVGLVVAGACVGYRAWERKRRRRMMAGDPGMEQELTPGPYKNLKSPASPTDSFRA